VCAAWQKAAVALPAVMTTGLGSIRAALRSLLPPRPPDPHPPTPPPPLPPLSVCVYLRVRELNQVVFVLRGSRVRTSVRASLPGATLNQPFNPLRVRVADTCGHGREAVLCWESQRRW